MGHDDDDPRLRADYRRTVDDGSSRVVLVGVVHDHPASAHRAGTVVTEEAPAVLALELPELAVPLFEGAVREDGTPDGEMSAAIRAARAAGTDHVVGVDAPSAAYLRALAGVVAERTPSPGALAGALRETLSVAGHAVRCRVAAATGAGRQPVTPVEHDVAPTDPPAEQAAHEATHLARGRSLLGALDPPAAVTLTDTAREAAMARRLDALREKGDVVAVVGFDHLDAVAGRLRSSDAADGPTRGR